MYRILIAIILIFGLTQQTFAYTLTTRDERTIDRLINRYELKIDREGDDIRPNILAQLERKLARFQRIGAYRLSAVYKLVINELTDVAPPAIPVPPVIPTTFELNTTNGELRYLRS